MHTVIKLSSFIKTLGSILAIAIIIFSRNADARVRVEILNELESGQPLHIHCRSRDDDLHDQTVEAGGAVAWDFEVNFMRTTLFYCDVQLERSSWYLFDAYDANRDYRRCKTLCRWMISKEGLLYGYDEDIGFWRMFPLIPTKSRS